VVKGSERRTGSAAISSSEEVPAAGPGAARSVTSGRERTWQAGLRLLRLHPTLLVSVAMFIALSIWSSAFFSRSNLLNLVDVNTAVGIIAIGETFVIIGGSFDLSVGSVYALGGVVSVILSSRIGVVPAILVTLALGGIAGIINGLIVVYVRVNSFIATLATEFGFAGAALIISGGNVQSTNQGSFSVLGTGILAGMPLAVWLFALMLVIAAFTLHRTFFGRYIFALGSRREAAEIAGIRVNAVRIGTFAACSLCAALAGVVDASRVSAADPTAGADLILTGIAAVVVGGTSILGGSGAIWKTFIGVMILGMITNGFDLLAINATYQQIVEGILIIIAVGAAELRSRPRRAGMFRARSSRSASEG
jgi:ribose transport system permease protein